MGTFKQKVNATARLLAKLPTTAAHLTPNERKMLRECEQEGIIQYIEQSGIWIHVTSECDGSEDLADLHNQGRI